jgi:hypothetical protein
MGFSGMSRDFTMINLLGVRGNLGYGSEFSGGDEAAMARGTGVMANGLAGRGGRISASSCSRPGGLGLVQAKIGPKAKGHFLDLTEENP